MESVDGRTPKARRLVGRQLHTHGSFEGVHLAGERLNLPSVVVGLLLCQPQSIIIPGRGFGQVSKLEMRREKKTQN